MAGVPDNPPIHHDLPRKEFAERVTRPFYTTSLFGVLSELHRLSVVPFSVEGLGDDGFYVRMPSRGGRTRRFRLTLEEVAE